MDENEKKLGESGPDAGGREERQDEPGRYRYRGRRHRSWRKVWLIALVVVVAAGALAAYWALRMRGADSAVVYHAVLLDNGQVYYGKIQGPEGGYTVLTDVYYVQQKVDTQTKEVSNVLIQRGNEWHGPDRMELSNRHIVMIEPVSPRSKVAQLIAELKQKGQ